MVTVTRLIDWLNKIEKSLTLYSFLVVLFMVISGKPHLRVPLPSNSNRICGYSSGHAKWLLNVGLQTSYLAYAIPARIPGSTRTAGFKAWGGGKQWLIVRKNTVVPHLAAWVCVKTIDWRHPILLPIRRSEEEKQMGLCNSRDPGPAHHPHHYRNAARCGLRDDHCRRHQDHGHLGGGHHPQEGQAVKRPEPKRCVWTLDEPRRPHHHHGRERIQRGVKRMVLTLTQKAPPDQTRRA